MFIVTPIVGVCYCSMFCCTLLYVHSSIAIILIGKRELVALLNLSSWCLVMVEWLFLAVPWGCLRFVIVVFPDHTRVLFLTLLSLATELLLYGAVYNDTYRKFFGNCFLFLYIDMGKSCETVFELLFQRDFFVSISNIDLY